MSDAAWWHGDPDRTPPRLYDGCTRTSEYVALGDGTRVAVDVFLPKGLPAGERIPTVLMVTPYFRAMDLRFPGLAPLFARLGMAGLEDHAAEITSYGYANVLLDVRGTGASFGVKRPIFMPDVVRDGAEVLDWIASRPWSNGAIGATGVSAVGMTANWLITAKHPALRAIAPRFTVFDIFEGTHPGGLVAAQWVRDIGSGLRAMDSNRLHTAAPATVRWLLRLLIRGLRPVDTDRGGRMLAAAVADHVANGHFDEDIVAVRHRDDPLPSTPDATLDTQSPFAHAVAMRDSAVPIYGWAGWADGAFSKEMIALHNNVPNPGSRIVIGPWGHGARYYCSTAVDGTTRTHFPHVAEMVRFFDVHLRDVDRGVTEEPPVHYFTMGEERWKSSPCWPPLGTETRRWWLAKGGHLSEVESVETGVDRHAVDQSATTGPDARFGRHLAGGRRPARWLDPASSQATLLHYESEPLRAETEITGHPVVSLNVSASTEDAAVIVRIEEVRRDGTVRHVTDGQLRASSRRTVPDPPYVVAWPWRAHRREDRQPLTPGEVVNLTFDLFPVSYLFSAGSRIRMVISGADRDNYLPVPEDGSAPVLEVHRGGDHASFLELPVMDRSPADARTM